MNKKRKSVLLPALCALALLVASCATGQGGGKEEDTAVYSEISVAKVFGLTGDFVMGVDISSIISELNSGVIYYDFDGNALDTVAKFCAFLKECGANTVRVRVWNNPYSSTTGAGYGGGNNDVACAVQIAKGCAEAGLNLLVDFHYSDFWATPQSSPRPRLGWG